LNIDQLAAMQSVGANFVIKAVFLTILASMEILLFILHKQLHSMNTIVTQPDMFPYLQTAVFFLEAAGAILIILTFVIL